MNKTQQRIVSSYAVRELGIRLGPDKFLVAVDLLRINPSMDGFIFEGWFIGCLARGPVTLKRLPAGNTIEWPINSLVHFDIVELQFRVKTFAIEQWLVPFKWNQSGFDIVFLDKTRGIVRFIQVTRASKHSFTANAFCDFLNCLHACEWMAIGSVELCYVVPRKTNREPSTRSFISTHEFYRSVVGVVFVGGLYRPYTEQIMTRDKLEKTEGTPIEYSVTTLEAAYNASLLTIWSYRGRKSMGESNVSMSKLHHQ